MVIAEKIKIFAAMTNAAIPVKEEIFHISSEKDFDRCALEIFSFQAKFNLVYKQFLKHIKVYPESVTHWSKIPFLPVELFKNHKITSISKEAEIVFTSSGTTGGFTSRHFVADVSVYQKSLLEGFKLFYGNPDKYVFLALLPSYLERQGSSLVYMLHELIKKSGNADGGFYLSNLDELAFVLRKSPISGKKYFLWGVSFALLQLAEQYKLKLTDCIVLETGGMKGRGREMVREELHEKLKESFQLSGIHSEYGMTELLSQAYSFGDGIFHCPPWMRIQIRDTNDPFSLLPFGSRGAINVIDLANFQSCSFIATSDLGRMFSDGSFEVLGRFDHSDVRGCNLLVQ